MADFPDGDDGYVACTRCNGDCGLAQIPELAEECSTMQSVKTGSAFEYAPDKGILPARGAGLPYDWEQQEQEQAEVAA